MKNLILKTTTWFMALLFVVSTAAVDSVSNIPKVCFFVSLAWLLLFGYANRHSKATVQDVVCGWE